MTSRCRGGVELPYAGRGYVCPTDRARADHWFCKGIACRDSRLRQPSRLFWVDLPFLRR